MLRYAPWTMTVLALVACAPALSLPDDVSVDGAAVGVRTVAIDGRTVDVWYPAEAGGTPESIDLDALLPQPFLDHVGDATLPDMPTRAVRDAVPLVSREPYPVVLFSHGLGGFRDQSVDYTVHLASRGYVVLSADHVGRRFQDILPCLFAPPLEGCDLSALADDPGPADLAAMADWIGSLPDDDALAPIVDPERLGISGHSAGGLSVGAFGTDDARVRAIFTMAMGPVVARDVPMRSLAGTCDGVVARASVEEGVEASVDAELVVAEGAGHLAFTDMCVLDIDAFAAEWLDDRDDLSSVIYKSIVGLGTDGCPGRVPDIDEGCDQDAYQDLSVSQTFVRAQSTEFFDARLGE